MEEDASGNCGKNKQHQGVLQQVTVCPGAAKDLEIQPVLIRVRSGKNQKAGFKNDSRIAFPESAGQKTLLEG